MRDDLRLPDLTFPDVKLGQREAPWNLNRWLYSDSAAIRVDEVQDAISSGRLGDPLVERIELVEKIHAAIQDQMKRGGSQHTAQMDIFYVTYFVRWADRTKRPFTLEEVEAAYLDWAQSLRQRVKVSKSLKPETAWSYASSVGRVLDIVLGRRRKLVTLTGLKQSKRRKTVQGQKADKQNLSRTFSFGHFLQDICDGLPLDVLWGPLPVRIPLRSGVELEQLCGLRPSRMTPEGFAAHEADRSLRTRYPLTNLRVLAELLLFIGQTGMNLEQAFQYRHRQFSYGASAEEDSLNVRDYKDRRGGEVLFQIFRNYKQHLERYLAWRRDVFPDSEMLFPVIRYYGGTERRPATFNQIKKACRAAGVEYVGPQSLRSTRINWILRETGDPVLTADMAQHAIETLKSDYERPSLQRAIREVGRFWDSSDPTLARTTPFQPLAPGACDGVPKVVEFKPKDAPSPDCQRPSGCLWCDHHRDIDSLDYVWALASFRHFKWCEVALYRPPLGNTSKHPAEFAIERISEMLTWFRDSNEHRREWVEEALARVEDAAYHPDWIPFIDRIDRKST